MRLRLALAVAASVLTGCAETGSPDQGPDPTAHADVTADDSPVKLVAKREADLVLYVSNQSFDDGEVDLSVAVDGVTVVDGEFDVEDQHTWVRFPLGMAPGAHEVTAESDSGATLRQSFDVPAEGTRYAVIDYWTEDDEPSLGWQLQREPVAFA